jgi:hypothetical protein
MEDYKNEIKTKDETTIKLYNSVYIWSIVENIVIILVTSLLFWLTESAWCFLFLISLNSISSIFKNSKKHVDNDENE